MKKTFFSIIIPLYNKENFIVKTVNSVLNQTFQDFEIIIVEDCSTDTSKSIAYSIVSDKIKLIEHEKNKGLSASRNTGIKNASSDFIVFLDADDIFKVNCLEKIYSLIDKFPSAGLYATNYDEVYAYTKKVKPTFSIKNNESDCIIDDYFEANLGQPIYSYSGVCIRKEVFENVGYFDTNITYGEDVDFNIRANLHYKLAYSFEPLVELIKFDTNQITNNGFWGKTIPDYDKYEKFSKENKNLKKFLDINRYMMANCYKKQNDFTNFYKLKNSISKDPKISGLNFKQRLLLNLPPNLLRFISKIKQFFLNNGIPFNSYSK